jgi:hypothetical protein
MFDAKRVKGIRVMIDLELTCIMLSRALFINSCSIDVDIELCVPTHMYNIQSKEYVCIVDEHIIHHDVSLYLHITISISKIL